MRAPDLFFGGARLPNGQIAASKQPIIPNLIPPIGHQTRRAVLYRAPRPATRRPEILVLPIFVSKGL
jgi:hypothetical protein